MKESSFHTPILFLIFNRPDSTQVVFNTIKTVRPSRLFIAADGPRKNNINDTELCQRTREIIHQIDWDCELTTLFRKENQGCKKAISSAIDWFFSKVGEGIILEDDCVPDLSFFQFCESLLDRYYEDKRVVMISGMNYLFNRIEMPESYFFSRYFPIWGWATWKRAWSQYDITMSEWPAYDSSHYLDHVYCDQKIVAFLREMFQKAYSGEIDTWDIQWVFSCIANHGLSICPKFNLISNIGTSGSHVDKVGRFHFMPVQSIDCYNLTHPVHVSPNVTLDRKSFDEILKRKSLHDRIRDCFIL